MFDLQYSNVKVQVVASKSSIHFYDRHQLEADNPGVHVWIDEDEWQVRSTPFAHHPDHAEVRFRDGQREGIQSFISKYALLSP